MQEGGDMEGGGEEKNRHFHVKKDDGGRVP